MWPMCSVPDGYGSISSTYRLRSLRGVPGTGFSTSKARSASQISCHLRSIGCGSYASMFGPQRRKSLSRERPGEAAAAVPRRHPGLSKELFHAHQRNRRFPMETVTQTSILRLFPETARVDGGELSLGGVPATALAQEFETPLVVYDEATLRAQARAYRAAASGALICYGSKAFPSLALLRLFASEGLGADVSTLGELRFALVAGLTG